MNRTTEFPTQPTAPADAPAGARAALKLLQRLRRGTLTVQLPDASVRRYGGGEGPIALLSLRNWNA
jgi:cyclopropane-fatty-acyl-phospholipid synthase